MRYPTVGGKEVEILMVADPEAAGRLTADLFKTEIAHAPARGLNICFSTGGTPLPTYKRLVEMHRSGEVSFSRVTAFNLDEYYDLPPEDSHTFRNFMIESLYKHVDLAAGRTHFINVRNPDPADACRKYEEEIAAAGGIDLMLMGIGRNGHIAFNEPGTPKNSRTRQVALTENTRKANARFFESVDQVPRYALSVGIANVLEARKVVLIATGSGKTEAIEKSLRHPASPDVPASFLQEHPGEVILILDEPAAARIRA